MLNWLIEKISEDGLSIDEHGSFEVVSSSFWKRKLPFCRLRRVTPPNDILEVKKFKKFKRKDHRLYKIEIDEKNSELHLFAVTPLTDKWDKIQNVTFDIFFEKALEASKLYSDLSVETTYQTDICIDEEGPIWIHFPIVGFIVDVESKKIILLETG